MQESYKIISCLKYDVHCDESTIDRKWIENLPGVTKTDIKLEAVHPVLTVQVSDPSYINNIQAEIKTRYQDSLRRWFDKT